MQSGAELQHLMAGGSLTRKQAHDLMNRVMKGEVPSALLAGILVALRTKGETVDEITGLAQAMRDNAIPVVPTRNNLVDTCGTGGDGTGTFNISTATAILSAAMGCFVAKHGNRAVSSACGSADVLEALGVNIALEATQVSSMVDEIGLGFLFAPQLHPAMKNAAEARGQLGVRTVFNVLGPLTNPAGTRRQLIGVFDPSLCETLAQVLSGLGAEKAFVVHGEGGLDEVSLLGSTQVAALDNGVVSTFTFHPREVGMDICKPEDLRGGNSIENANIIRKILAGDTGPAADVVILNAAFVAVLAGVVDDFGAGVELARKRLADGSARRVLAEMATSSQSLAKGLS
jgi:anthranilate phosphoribosyltransferase